MNILVCMKAVASGGGTGAGRGDAELIPNPADLTALEEALTLRDRYSGRVSVITMGAAVCESMLRQALGMGADRAILLSDSAFAGADTAATSRTLAAAIGCAGDFDMIFCGSKTTDGETGQVGVELAMRLGRPWVANCIELHLADNRLLCRCLNDRDEAVLSAPINSVLTFKYGINSPRLPSLAGLRRAREEKIRLLTNAELRLTGDQCGQSGSPTAVLASFSRPFEKRSAIRLRADDEKRAARYIRAALPEKEGGS